MTQHDSTDAFDALVQREFVSRLDSIEVGSTINPYARYRRGFCAGYRTADPVVGSLYGAMVQTCERLTRRKAWSNRSVVFSATVEGDQRKLYPLVEYRLPKSKRACRLVRDDASYYLTDRGRVVVFDSEGDGEYITPSQDYWLYNEEDRNYVRFLLETVSGYCR